MNALQRIAGKVGNRLIRFAGLNRRASLENPSVSLQDPDAWNEMFGGGMRTDAGVMVSHSGALKFAPVWQAVSMISGDVAKMPLDVYRRGDGDAREVDRAHPAFWLVRRKANREMSAFDFWRVVMTHALLWNNAYVYIDRNGRGDPIELLPLLPDRTAPERIGGEMVYVTETQRPDGTPWTRALPARDVLHIHDITIDGVCGCDLVEAMRNAIGVGLAAEGFTAKFFKHGVRSSGILELPIGMKKPVQDVVEEGFRKYSEGPENWFKTVILRDGAKYHQVSMKAAESQVIEQREAEVRDVARFYRLAPSRLGISDSVSYNSKAEDNQAYLDSTLSTWLTCIASECWMKLLSQQQQNADSHYFEHNTASLLRMNALMRHQVYAIGIQNGMYSPNVCLAKENMNPREGGDVYVEPKQNGSASPGAGANGQNQSTGDNPGGTDPAQTDAKKKARQRVIFNLTARARHKAKNPRAFIEWIDGGLVQHRTEAVELMGSDEDIAVALEWFRNAAESATASQLAGVVDEISTRLESED